MNLSILDNALWAASFVGHVALVCILLIRRRFRQFPVFTGFLGFEALSTLLLFVVSRGGSRRAYFLSYWITGFLNYGLQVALIAEVAREILRPTGTWVRDARSTFLGWGLGGLLAAGAFASQIGPPQAKGLNLWEVRVTIFTSLLTCALFLAVSAGANRLGLQWRSHVMALGQGLFVWAFISLLEDFAHVVLGWNREFVVFAHARMFAYLSVLVYWMVAFWLPERQRAPLSSEMNAYLLALHKRVQYDLTSVDGPNR